MTSPTGSNAKKSNQAAVASGKWRVLSVGQFATRHSSLITPRGLTLIEVLISVVLLASGAVLLMQSFAGAWEVVARTDERSTALVFAMSKLADLQLAHQQGRELAEHASGQFRAQSKPFTWSVDVQPNSAVADDFTRRLTLSISWPRGGDTDSAQYTLLLAPLPKDEAQEGA